MGYFEATRISKCNRFEWHADYGQAKLILIMDSLN